MGRIASGRRFRVPLYLRFNFLSAEGSGKTTNCLHPGVIKTNLARHLDNAEALFASLDNLKTIPQGAANQTLLAAHPAAAEYSGEYFSDCQVAVPRATVNDAELAERLWTWTEELVASL